MHVCVLFGLLLLLWTMPALAGPTTNLRGTSDAWLTITSNISNGTGVLGGTVTPASSGYQLAECMFSGPAWGGSVAAQGAMTLWICTEIDGTTFEKCDTTDFSSRRPDAVFPLRNTGSAAQIVKQVVVMPPGPLKALLRNDSGVALNGATTTATLTCRPFTPSN